jgi:glycosyltransferase involved in cell wall biosynthesis
MLVQNGPYPQDGRIRHEAHTLANGGYGVLVICPRWKQQRWTEEAAGVRVYRFPMLNSSGGFFGYLLEYSYSMAVMFALTLFVALRHNFDVIHTANPPDTLVLIAAFYKLFGKRYVYDEHDLCADMYQARGGRNQAVYQLLLLFEKLSCRLADHVIATNESYKKLQMERAGVPTSRITVVRNGPELHPPRQAEPDPEIRKRADTILVFLGNMGFQDGVDYLFRSLGQLDQLGKRDWYCILIGHGDAQPSAQRIARQLHIDDRVEFTGFLPAEQYLPLLCAADICVDPDPSNFYTDRSTMGKMMDYMLAGKPIVAFDLPEHRVTAADSACYAAPNDECDFAREIAELMGQPERRASMGEIGRARVQNKLAWDYSAPALLSAYSKLCSEMRKEKPASSATKEINQPSHSLAVETRKKL